MSMICDNCKKSTLSVLESMEVDPDEFSDQRMIQILGCSHCSFMGIGLLEKPKNTSLDDAGRRHRAFYVPSDKVVRLLNLMQHKRRFDVEEFLNPGPTITEYQSFLVQKS